MADDLLAQRRAKLERLREQGIDPFPHAFEGVESIADVRAAHAGLEPRGGDRVAPPARRPPARAPRPGRMAFLDLDDRSGRIQLQAKRDLLGEERMDLLLELDLGDIVGIDGVAFMSRRGELTLRVEDFTVLAKSLRPPPDKHHGLHDVETRYRRRELDLIANEEARELFIARAKIVTAVRRYLDDNGFVEVETPVLQPLYGGALAPPFTTHFNALDQTMYLRIATELYLKRCIVGGLERVYELGKDFRNEGLSPKHNPEFTMVEWYEAYADYNDAMRRLEEVVARGRRRPSATRARSTSRRRGGASRCATRSSRRPASTCSPTATARRSSPRSAPRRSSSRTSTSAPGRSSSTTCCRSSSSPSSQAPTFIMRLPRRALAVRQGPPHRGGPRRALRGVRRSAWRSPTRSPSSTTPTTSARASRPRSATATRATRRPSPTTRSSSRRWSRGCRRPAASASASTASTMVLTGQRTIREVVLFPALKSD